MKDDIQRLIKDAQAGDESAFRRLVENYQLFVYNLAFRLLTNQEDAKDVVQECFVRVWKNLTKFNVKKKFTTWLYKIVINLCYDDLRRAYNKYKCDPIEKEESLNLLVEKTSFEEKISNLDLAHKIKLISCHLKPQQRMVFVLRDLQDLKMDEIAHILKISVGTVKSNLYYARLNIRKKCEQMELIK